MLLQCVTDMRRTIMENLHMYLTGVYREYKYAADASAIMIAEYTKAGYFSTEDVDPVLTAEREVALSDAMELLSSQQRSVIEYFLNHYSSHWMEDLAMVMDVSPLRVKQLYDKAIYRLRRYIADKAELWT